MMEKFLKECAEKYGNTTAFEIKRKFRREKFSFRDIYEYSMKTANFLTSKGLKRGDKVLIWSPNMPEWIIVYFGSMIAGGVVVPIDFRTSPKTVSKFIDKTKTKLAFKSRYLRGDIERLIPNIVYMEDLMDIIKDFHGKKPKVKIKKDDLAEIVFTSGTTGEPKGVMITFKNIFSDINAASVLIPARQRYEVLSILPLSHMYGQMITFLVLKIGAKTIFLPKINSITIHRALQENRITIFPVVPQLLRILLDSVEKGVKKQKRENQWKKLLKISSHLPFFIRKTLFRRVHKAFGDHIEFFVCGAAPLDLKLATTWEIMGFKILEAYGATEVTTVATGTTLEERKLGAVGKPLSGVKLKLNPDGEILVKGNMVSQGYYKNEQKTKQAFKDGWYRTGDIGRFDEDGYLQIVGRDHFKIVLPDGMNVYPEDIEKKLNKHPLVWDSCVLGIRKERGETVHAALIMKEKGDVKRVIDEVNKELEFHQQIMEYSIWPEEDFPRTITLKPDRRKIYNFIVKKESFDKEGTLRKKEIQERGKLIQIIAEVTRIDSILITDESNLVTDLGLDSLNRAELTALIEEEMGVVIDEMSITPQTKVSDLKNLIREGTSQIQEIKIKDWLYGWTPRLVRETLQKTIVFPFFNTFTTIKVENKENLKKIRHPSILIFNHAGNGDGVLVLKILPSHIRTRTIIAIMAEHWEHKLRVPLLHLFSNVFPFARSGYAVRPSLEALGKFLDKGWSILFAPEGEVPNINKLQEFKQGIGFIAVEMGVPVVPFKIEGYFGVIPLGKMVPQKKANVTIKVGEPIIFPKNTSYLESTQKLREIIKSL